MKTSRFAWSLVAWSCCVGVGCRDAAPGTATDSGARPDASASVDTVPAVPEGAVEAGPEAVPASGGDVGPDRGSDRGRDSGVEAARETGPESGPDTGVEAGNDSGGTDGRARYSGLPQPMCVWNQAYQENYAADTVTEILAGARGCYVLVDPFADSTAAAAVGQIQQLGNTVGCYISVGTCENWRDDFAAMKPYCVSKEWGDWPGEYFVDRTDPALVALMEARIAKLAAWGCDLVEFDNMDWTFDAAYRSQYGITATSAEGEAYNQTLCAYVHGKGMGCMAKSSAQGAGMFDGLTVESSPADMDWWTPTDLSGMLSSGKLGIVVHYDETDCASVLAHYRSEYGGKLSFICEDRALEKYRHFP